MNCSRKGCTKTARWWPVLELRAAEYHQDHEAAPMFIPLPHCDEHKAEEKPPASFLTESGWMKVREKFRQMGKALPKQKRTTIIWVHMESEEGRALTKSVAVVH